MVGVPPQRLIDCPGLTFAEAPKRNKQHPFEVTVYRYLQRKHTPPTMSSPEQRRSNRSSVNGTPRRSGRSSQAPASSPSLPNNGTAAADEQLRTEANDANMQDVTPRGNTRLSQDISQSQAPPTSSPLFFRSSPNGSQSQSQQGGRAVGASSPLKSQADLASSDGGRTPRASGGMGGGRSFGQMDVAHVCTNAT